MYTLRTIYKEENGWQPKGTVTNYSLGTCYTVINRELSKDYHDELIKQYGWAKDDAIYSIVRDQNGDHHPLYNHSDHFVMTESGKTFERI